MKLTATLALIMGLSMVAAEVYAQTTRCSTIGGITRCSTYGGGTISTTRCSYIGGVLRCTTY